MSRSRPPLKVLHLASSERWTGVAEPVVSLACAQKEMGLWVRVACVPGRSFARRVRERGIDLVEGLRLDRRLHPLHLLSDRRFLPRLCREENIEIIHSHLPHDHWLAAWALRRLRAERAGRPLLVRTIHDGVAPRTDWFHRRLFLKQTDRLVCVSAGASRNAEAAFHLPSGSIPHVRGAVDLRRFRPGLDGLALRAEFGIPSDAPVAGIVTRMRAGRGLRWLLRAVPAILNRVPLAHFMGVGRGELKKWFRQKCEEPAYRGQVHYVGYRKEDLPQTYAAMDVSLFLGLGSEGTCRAILEAMGCARPTIGADAGAVDEIIVGGETGLLVRDRDPEDLADKIAEMLGNRQLCAAMGKAARRRAEERFNEKARARAFVEIYEKLIEEKTVKKRD